MHHVQVVVLLGRRRGPGLGRRHLLRPEEVLVGACACVHVNTVKWLAVPPLQLCSRRSNTQNNHVDTR